MYSWDLQKRIHVLREHSTSIKSLAIHGTKPYVLSASCDGKILLWDYGNGWHLIKTFDTNSQLDEGDTVEQVVFNPNDTDMFASAQGKTVKVCLDFLCMHSVNVNLDIPSFPDTCICLKLQFWNLHSGECKHTLSGHSDLVVCLDYFSLGHNLYLITGSQDRTAKVWQIH